MAGVGAVKAKALTECSRASLSSGASSKPAFPAVPSSARAVPASRLRWANPIRPSSSAATLAGSPSAASPVAIERAAACPDMAH